MALVYEALAAARTHLDDDTGDLWPDTRLLPKLQEAHRELQLKLRVNGVSVLSTVTSVLTVPALVTDLTLSIGYPTNLVEPIRLEERDPSQDDSEFHPMFEVDFIPSKDQDTDLFYWTWNGEKVLLLGSSTISEVRMRYKKSLSIPEAVTDPVGVISGELYLSYRTAALAVGGTRGAELTATAVSHLETIMRAAAKDGQNLPTRRQGYHRGRGRNYRTWM